MTTENSSADTTNTGRRHLLKALAGTGAAAAVVPNDWAKPVLQSIALPAHAQTSAQLALGGYIGNDIVNQESAGSLLDNVVSPAQASHSVDGINGGCLLLTFISDIVQLVLNYADGQKDEGQASISNGSFSTFIGPVPVSGDVDYNSSGAPVSCTGLVDGHRFVATESGSHNCRGTYDLTGVNANCLFNVGDHGIFGPNSFSLCFSARITEERCFGASTMSYDVIMNGTVVAQCGPRDRINSPPFGAPPYPCFSCTITNENFLSGTASAGDQFTLDVTFNNGCRCNLIVDTW